MHKIGRELPSGGLDQKINFLLNFVREVKTHVSYNLVMITKPLLIGSVNAVPNLMEGNKVLNQQKRNLRQR